MDDNIPTDSDSEESPDSESPDVTPPLEVKLINPDKPKPEWNDECDDVNYFVIELTDEEKNI